MSLIFLNFLRMFANSLSTRACSASLLGALRMSWMKMFSPRIPEVAIVSIGVGRTRALFAPSFLNWTRARLELDALDPALVFVSARLSANESRRRRRTVGIVSPSPPSVRALRVDHNARRGDALDVDARVHRRRLDFARVHDARRSRVAVSRGARESRHAAPRLLRRPVQEHPARRPWRRVSR